MEHLQHLRVMLSVLREHQLCIKRSKCAFATESVSYLGHVISATGVAMDEDKVEVVTSWLQLASTWVL
jgi:hypothetical protein